METTRWTNPSLPQTLQSAVILLYINAAFMILFGGLGGIGLLIMAAYIGGGFGIANERRWGYQVAIGAAFSPFVFGYLILGWRGIFPGTIDGLLTIAFDILLIALLLHPQSRDYQRVWFN